MDISAKAVRFDDDSMWVDLSDGRTIGVPYAWFPRLLNATPKQRDAVEIGRFGLHWVDPFGGDAEEQVGEDRIVAPLPGTVVALLAEVGAKLEKGAPILTLEVMKMEQTLRAPFAGVLKAIKCKVGDIVGEGVELAEIEPA